MVLRVVRDPNPSQRRLDTKETASFVFSAMWTPVIMLLLGGFTIAAALSKHNVAKRMATFVLSKAGTKPRVVLLTSMFIAMVSSMLISNVAAPVLCYSILQVSGQLVKLRTKRAKMSCSLSYATSQIPRTCQKRWFLALLWHPTSAEPCLPSPHLRTSSHYRT